MSEHVDSAALVYFRIVLGITAYFWADSFLVDDKYRVIFLTPRFLFKYEGFQWVQLWPGEGIYWHFVLAKVASICLAVGFLTRLAAAAVSFSIVYVLLVERAIYVNHYYLLACAAGLLVFLPAGRRFAVDCWLGWTRREQTIPRWQLWMLRFQLGLPYVGGGLAKLNRDWLAGQPAGLIVSQESRHPLLGPILSAPGATEVFAYGGLFYDLLVVPLLLYRPTRWIAVGLSVVFHLTNAMTLQIGVFPWFMLATLVVFFPPETMTRRVRIFLGQPSDPDRPSHEVNEFPKDDSGHAPNGTSNGHSKAAGSWSARAGSWFARSGYVAAIAYVVLQLCLPLRPWFLPGDANWNERGHRFAWRMMLRQKYGLTHFLILDDAKDDFLYVPSTLVLTGYQSDRADHHPELVRQTAVQLSRLAAELGATDNRVHALALVSLNGRKPTPLVDPTVDLSKVERHWFRDKWEVAEPGPLLNPPWTVPRERWWIDLELPEPFKESLQGRTPEELRQYLKQLNPR